MRRDILIQSGVRFHEDMILMEDFCLCWSCFRIAGQYIPCRKQSIVTDRRRMKIRLLSPAKITDLAEYIQPIADGIGRLQIPRAEAITEKYTK